MAKREKTASDLKNMLKAFYGAFGWPYFLKILIAFGVGAVASLLINFGDGNENLLISMYAGLIAAQGIIFAVLSSHSSEVLKFAEDHIKNEQLNKQTRGEYESLLMGGFQFQVVAWLALVFLVVAAVAIVAGAPRILKIIFCWISLGLFSLGIWSSLSFAFLDFQIAWRAHKTPPEE
jgi:hypothetical protein